MATDETVQKEEMRAYQPSIPFPQRMKQSKLDNQYAKFLNVFKKLEINIPFVEALVQMPHYAKLRLMLKLKVKIRIQQAVRKSKVKWQQMRQCKRRR